MRPQILAWVILAVTVGFAVTNTALLAKQTDDILKEVEGVSLDGDPEAARAKLEAIYDSFKNKEKYISITVNHEDLTNIEQSFSEIIGYLAVGDTDGATVIKHRLTDSLEHLRRLSAVNLESII